MAERIKINGTEIKQPLQGLGYGFQTKFSKESTRVQSGRDYSTPVYTYETFSYNATGLTAQEMSDILKSIAHGEPFTLHYMSPYYGEWRDDEFKVENGAASVARWIEEEERYDALSFTMIGVNPIEKR